MALLRWRNAGAAQVWWRGAMLLALRWRNAGVAAPAFSQPRRAVAPAQRRCRAGAAWVPVQCPGVVLAKCCHAGLARTHLTLQILCV